MKTYAVTMKHPHGYTVTVTVFARNIHEAKREAADMHKGAQFVSAVLQEA